MILVLDAGSSKTPFIAEAVDAVCDVKTIRYLELSESDLKAVRGIIISGAPILVTDVDPSPYLEVVKTLIETNLPILGICFGHQILGMHFGAEASRMKEDRDLQTVEAYEECILFNKLPTEVQMIEDHCETISIPAGFQLVASSDACVNEAMQHLSLPYFGVQFHPEVSGNHGAILIENFVEFCLKEDYP